MKYKVTIPMDYVEAYINCEAEAIINWSKEKMDRYLELNQKSYEKMSLEEETEYECLQNELYDEFLQNNTIFMIDKDFEISAYEYGSIDDADIKPMNESNYEQINLFDGDIT